MLVTETQQELDQLLLVFVLEVDERHLTVELREVRVRRVALPVVELDHLLERRLAAVFE